MKRMKFVLACSLLMGGLAVGAVQSSYVKKVNAEELVYKTLTFSKESNSKAVSSYSDSWSATIDGFTWNITNFNNNNNGWNFIRAGSNKAASTATIATDSIMDKEISAVKVTVDAVTASFIESTSLTVASDKNFTNIVATVAKDAEKGTMIYEIAEPVASAYYKLTYNCKKASSNGPIQISKVEYCYETINPDLPTYTTTFYANDGTEDAYSAVSVNAGQKVEFPEDPTREGYIFEGWYTDPAEGEKVTSIESSPEQDTNLYAHWKQETSGDIFARGDTKAQLSASYTKVGKVTEKVYKKVTSDLIDWTGEYLIVYEDGSLVFDGSLTTLDAISNYKSVTISGDEISATENENYSFTFEKVEGGYAIKSSSGYYIGNTANGNDLKSSKTTQYPNKISFVSNEEINIISSESYLRFNSTSNQTRFRYFKSTSYTNQKAIQLYRAEGGDTAEYTITDATIRYGSIMPKEVYDENASYGLLVTSGKVVASQTYSFADVLELAEDLDEDGKISAIEFELTLEEFYGTEATNYENIIPVKTDVNGDADENGDFYQFGVRFTDTLKHIDTALCAAAYMEVDGQVYLASETNYSLRTLAEEYLRQGILADNADAQGILNAILNYGL